MNLNHTENMNEQIRPIQENHFGSGGVGSLFAEEEEATPQLVRVECGFHREHLPVGNMTVGEIRARFRDRFDIDPRSQAVLDGNDVSDQTVVQAGQVLVFAHIIGAKGQD
jgi:hypothetical protein